MATGHHSVSQKSRISSDCLRGSELLWLTKLFSTITFEKGNNKSGGGEEGEGGGGDGGGEGGPGEILIRDKPSCLSGEQCGEQTLG